MDNHSLAIVSDIIQRSSRLQPADAVLRGELKNQRRLPPSKTRQISSAIFAYFRWFGWLTRSSPIRDQIVHALDLAEKFAALEPGKPCPREFSDSELVARVVPHWLGEEMEITPGFARSLQTPPKLWLRARPGTGPKLADALDQKSHVARESPSHATDVMASPVCEPFPGAPDILSYCGDEDLFRSKEFHSGAFELQDISSQAVSLICAPAPGQTWWDACAGEGGKTLHLCDLMNNKGLVWASDRAEWRLKKLKRRAARSRIFNYRARIWDGSPILPTKTKFDGVMLDAPCSGIGTWQRNPHARWTTTLQDIHELGALQIKLLTAAAAAVKPGGKVIYAVCTLTRSETTGVVEAFQSKAPGFTPLAFTNPLVPDSPASETLALLPQDHSGNGMFIAAWARS
jgi:16S rRNA (cytosine967-C5)-methyltransferase